MCVGVHVVCVGVHVCMCVGVHRCVYQKNGLYLFYSLTIECKRKRQQYI